MLIIFHTRLLRYGLAHSPIYNGVSAILLQAQSGRNFEPSNSDLYVASRIRKETTNMAVAERAHTPINGVAVDQLFSTVEAVKATPSIAKFKFQITNRWNTGSQNCSTASGFSGANQQLGHPQPFSLQADEPAILLGKDTAANPVEYLLHALASCLTTSMVYHAAARGIRIDNVESSFEGDLDLRGFLDLDPAVRKGYQGIRARFKITADAPDDQLQEIVRLGTGHSPVFDSITRGVPVSVSAERL